MESEKNELTDMEKRFVVTRVGKQGEQIVEGGQKVLMSDYKISKSWGYKVQHADYG